MELDVMEEQVEPPQVVLDEEDTEELLIDCHTFIASVLGRSGNPKWMEKEGPTDVLSFPIDAEDALTDGQDHHVLLGDVVICPAVAHRNAPGHAGTYPDEIALLTVHGILHVLGHDHAEPEETMVMQARERELLERFHRSVR